MYKRCGWEVFVQGRGIRVDCVSYTGMLTYNVVMLITNLGYTVSLTTTKLSRWPRVRLFRPWESLPHVPEPILLVSAGSNPQLRLRKEPVHC
jgi:hypothetical protein